MKEWQPAEALGSLRVWWQFIRWGKPTKSTDGIDLWVHSSDSNSSHFLEESMCRERKCSLLAHWKLVAGLGGIPCSLAFCSRVFRLQLNTLVHWTRCVLFQILGEVMPNCPSKKACLFLKYLRTFVNVSDKIPWLMWNILFHLFWWNTGLFVLKNADSYRPDPKSEDRG